MSMTDPIADFLTRLRNAAKAQQHDVKIPASGIKREIARILKEQGYVEDWSVGPAGEGRPGDVITVTLKYTADRKPVISGLERVSRPGQRTYVNSSSIPKIQGGMGTAIISTSRGLMTGHDARIQGVGGEVVARVW